MFLLVVLVLLPYVHSTMIDGVRPDMPNYYNAYYQITKLNCYVDTECKAVFLLPW